MTKVSFSEDKDIKKYKKELKEISRILNQDIFFVSDDSPCWFNEQSSHFNINESGRKFNILKLTVSYNLNFSSLFDNNKMPRMIDVLKYIKENRTSQETFPLPSNLKHWGGVTKIEDHSVTDPELRYPLLGAIIDYKEQMDYHKGLALTDKSFSESGWEKDYKTFVSDGPITLHFEDGSTKEFKNQEEIYYFILASCSNDRRFRYNNENLS